MCMGVAPGVIKVGEVKILLLSDLETKNMALKMESVKEEIEELKKKLALLDGDKKACFENTQWDIERNRIQIQQLRKENKDLRNKLAKKTAVSLNTPVSR